MIRCVFFIVLFFTTVGFAKEYRHANIAKKLCHYQEITDMDNKLGQENKNFVLAYDCYTSIIHKNILDHEVYARIQQYSQICLVNQTIKISQQTRSDELFKKSYTECFLPSLY
ncbi:MAG: hypothetical protein MK008_11275 [Bdellovibrionales bacterium]|nr:hypothetical protein [Bdellovibrionales bacterium]